MTGGGGSVGGGGGSIIAQQSVGQAGAQFLQGAYSYACSGLAVEERGLFQDVYLYICGGSYHHGG